MIDQIIIQNIISSFIFYLSESCEFLFMYNSITLDYPWILPDKSFLSFYTHRTMEERKHWSFDQSFKNLVLRRLHYNHPRLEQRAIEFHYTKIRTMGVNEFHWYKSDRGNCTGESVNHPAFRAFFPFSKISS